MRLLNKIMDINKENKTIPITILICKNNKPFPVNEIGPELKLDQEYKLEEIYKCHCGEEHYNVGLQLNINYVECYKCREKLPLTTHWCNSSRFEKK